MSPEPFYYLLGLIEKILQSRTQISTKKYQLEKDLLWTCTSLHQKNIPNCYHLLISYGNQPWAASLGKVVMQYLRVLQVSIICILHLQKNGKILLVTFKRHKIYPMLYSQSMANILEFNVQTEWSPFSPL